MLDKQGWYCFGCGIGGDVLQLVEFLQSGTVTSGQTGAMPESHRQARDYLAEKAGVHPLSKMDLNPEQRARVERDRHTEERVYAVLGELAARYYKRLKAHPEVIEWITSHYAIAESTIDELLIGYADNEPDVGQQLISDEYTFTKKELIATGAIACNNEGTLRPFYDRRVVFPYWYRGNVVFMSGRKTPWTPENKWEQGKYKKLPVYDKEKRDHIARCINNAVLYNEDCLLTSHKRLIITEGITDCIALMQQEFPVVSPATVHIRNADWERLLPQLRRIDTIYLCHDSEVSEAGIQGALQTANLLADNGIRAKILELPLDETRLQARRHLKERFDITSADDLKHKKTVENAPEIERFLAQAKRDVNDYFREGHTATDFEALLSSAMTPLEYSISRLDPDGPEEERNRCLEPMLEEVARLSPLEQNRHLKLIQQQCQSSGLTLAVLREQIRAIHKNQRKESEPTRYRAETLSPESVDTCKELIAQVLGANEGKPGVHEYSRAAEAAYEWFLGHGAQFFRTSNGEPFLFFENAMLWMDSPDRGRKRIYASVMYKHTEMVQTTGGGKTFFEVLANLAVERGQLREHFSWLHTDVSNYTVYFNLNNPAHKIARISPDGVDILHNGGNEDGIILDGSRKKFFRLHTWGILRLQPPTGCSKK